MKSRVIFDDFFNQTNLKGREPIYIRPYNKNNNQIF